MPREFPKCFYSDTSQIRKSDIDVWKIIPMKIFFLYYIIIENFLSRTVELFVGISYTWRAAPFALKIISKSFISLDYKNLLEVVDDILLLCEVHISWRAVCIQHVESNILRIEWTLIFTNCILFDATKWKTLFIE